MTEFLEKFLDFGLTQLSGCANGVKDNVDHLKPKDEMIRRKLEIIGEGRGGRKREREKKTKSEVKIQNNFDVIAAGNVIRSDNRVR